jgi:hypothetical protein
MHTRDDILNAYSFRVVQKSIAKHLVYNPGVQESEVISLYSRATPQNGVQCARELQILLKTRISEARANTGVSCYYIGLLGLGVGILGLVCGHVHTKFGCRPMYQPIFQNLTTAGFVLLGLAVSLSMVNQMTF